MSESETAKIKAIAERATKTRQSMAEMKKRTTEDSKHIFDYMTKNNAKKLYIKDTDTSILLVEKKVRPSFAKMLTGKRMDRLHRRLGEDYTWAAVVLDVERARNKHIELKTCLVFKKGATKKKMVEESDDSETEEEEEEGEQEETQSPVRMAT